MERPGSMPLFFLTPLWCALAATTTIYYRSAKVRNQRKKAPCLMARPSEFCVTVICFPHSVVVIGRIPFGMTIFMFCSSPPTLKLQME